MRDGWMGGRAGVKRALDGSVQLVYKLCIVTWNVNMNVGVNSLLDPTESVRLFHTFTTHF